jgi:hypothetical protein
VPAAKRGKFPESGPKNSLATAYSENCREKVEYKREELTIKEKWKVAKIEEVSKRQRRVDLKASKRQQSEHQFQMMLTAMSSKVALMTELIRQKADLERMKSVMEVFDLDTPLNATPSANSSDNVKGHNLC